MIGGVEVRIAAMKRKKNGQDKSMCLEQNEKNLARNDKQTHSLFDLMFSFGLTI